MIAFSCSHCGLKLQVKPEFAGRATKCPACKQPLVVPPSDQTEAQVLNGGIEGRPSNLVQTGVNGGVTVAQGTGAVPLGKKPVQESLTWPAKRGERYVVEAEIARGGMGAVLRAVDNDICREVAVKYLLDQTDWNKRLRFIEEAKITGQLEHPNIVPVHELGVDAQKRLFFSMKMVKGRSLAEVLEQLRKNAQTAEKEYPLGRLLNVFVSLCNALAYAHSRGVIHRDLKPANIMIGDFGEVYLMDWGLAKVLKGGFGEFAGLPEAVVVPPSHDHTAPSAIPVEPGSGVSSKPSSKVVTGREPDIDLTQEGDILGTMAYAAPEQATGQVQLIDQRSDIYSLGAILYEMLTLLAPVDKEGGHLKVMIRVMNGTIVPAEERAPQRARAGKIPRELSAIARKALAKEPGDRYPNVEALRRDIERFQEGRSVSAKDDTFRETVWKLVKRNRGFSAGAAAALLVLLASLMLVGRVRLQESKAYAEYRKAEAEKQQLGRDSVPALVRSARMLINEGDFPEARKQLNAAVGFDERYAPARLVRAQLAIVGQDYAAAQRDLDVYVNLRPDDALAKQLANQCRTARADNVAHLMALADTLAGEKEFALSQRVLDQSQKVKISQQELLEHRQKLLKHYQKRIEVVWPGLGGKLSMEFATGALMLNLAGSKQVTSLAALEGMPLVALNLDNCHGVEDLTPLKRMPLAGLSLVGCPKVPDLTALRGMPLTNLNLAGCDKLTDLTPLRGKPLTTLNLSSCPKVTDLTPLRGMLLTTLHLTGTNVADLTPLRGMPLTFLSLHGCPKVTDLKPLRGMPLTTLNLTETNVAVLTPLRGMPLTWLSLHGCLKLTDLKPLRGMPLTTLNLSSCPKATDLTPLRGMPLTTLNLTATNVADLTPLRGMPLTFLSLHGSPKATDLTPLRGMPLTTLHLTETNVADLTPLHGMPLTFLNLPGCPKVTDLTPLRGMPLTTLNLVGCDKVTDLTPLQGMNLTEITLNTKPVYKGMDSLRRMKSLKVIVLQGKMPLPAADFWKKYDAGEFT